MTQNNNRNRFNLPSRSKRESGHKSFYADREIGDLIYVLAPSHVHVILVPRKGSKYYRHPKRKGWSE